MNKTVNKPTVYIICGFIGAGKTTFSKKLANETGAIHITKDEWMVKIFGSNAPTMKDFSILDNNVSKLATDFAFKLVEHGIDVILDEGFWAKSQRQELKKRVEKAGAKWVLYYVSTPTDEMKKRVLDRSKNPGKKSFEISDEMFDSYLRYWQPPEEDEEFILVK